MKKGYSYVIILIIMSSVVVNAIENVRLGSDGILHCAYPGAVLIDVTRVTLRPNQDEQNLVLYSSGTNSSTDKFVLAADFTIITVRNVMVRDEGEYRCQVSYNPFGSTRTMTSVITLIVYGKQNSHFTVGVRIIN